MSNLKNQSGITLLLSILILSGVTLTTLAVASFTIQQLRSSRAVLLSEPALAAAESAGEQGIWSLKRNVGLPPNSQGLNNGAGADFEVSYATATVAIKANTDYIFYLYDPAGINTDTDLSGYPYSWLDVKQKSGGFKVDVTVSRLDGSVSGLSPASTSAFPGSVAARINIDPVQTSTEGRIQVTLHSINDATVEINTDRGMPNLPTVNSTGCSTARGTLANCGGNGLEVFTRKIQVTVPQ